MPRLRLLTAGESHGPGLVAILEGLPHGLAVDKAEIDGDLKQRQGGYGRGGRMKIEKDQVEVLAGLRGGRTLGSPLAMLVRNLDFASWEHVMHPFEAPTGEGQKALTRPRPGHADLAGAIKLGLHDARDVLERSSARSTAVRVAAGTVCKSLLRACGVEIMSHVMRIGDVTAPALAHETDLADARARAEASTDVRCCDAEAGARMVQAIQAAQRAGDSLGGVVEVVAWGLPPGIGSHVEWDLRLDGRIAHALMSIQAMKGVEIGLGFEAAARPGSAVHDPIHYAGGVFVRPSNGAGGIEGGNTNGQPVVVRAAMKPIPTLARPLASVELTSKSAFDAQKERTDACAVPAAAVVAEAALAFVLADALLDKTGGDSMDEVLRNLRDIGMPSRVIEARPVFLIGMMGTGKSTVGRLLAQRLQRRFVNLDSLIEEENLATIPEIWLAEGEKGFRARETRALKRVVNEGPQVVAVGGGAPVQGDNMDLMLAAGAVVCLSASAEELEKRLGDARTRPLLVGKNITLEIKKLEAARGPTYARAHFTIDTTGLAPSQIARHIGEELAAWR